MQKIPDIKRALFLNFGGIGDEILFFPTLKDFRIEYPGCHLTLLLEPRSAGCINLTDTVDEVVKYDVKTGNKIKSFLDLLFLIRSGHYDAVISAGSNKFIGILLFLSGIKTRVGYDSGALSRKILSTAVPLNKQQYAANMYHDLLKGVGIDKDTPLPEIIVDEQALVQAEQMLGPKQKPFIVVHPGVSKLSVIKKIIKSWPEQKWAELICSLVQSNKYKVVLCGGPDDEETISHIRHYLKEKGVDSPDFIDLFGKTKNLKELAAVIKLSDLLVCVDSAPLHLAVGVKTKIVAIFGPTDENKLLPKNKEFLIIRKQDLSCRPCLWDKRSVVCNDISCLDIPVEQVLDGINSQQIIE